MQRANSQDIRDLVEGANKQAIRDLVEGVHKQASTMGMVIKLQLATARLARIGSTIELLQAKMHPLCVRAMMTCITVMMQTYSLVEVMMQTYSMVGEI